MWNLLTELDLLNFDEWYYTPEVESTFNAIRITCLQGYDPTKFLSGVFLVSVEDYAFGIKAFQLKEKQIFECYLPQGSKLGFKKTDIVTLPWKLRIEVSDSFFLKPRYHVGDSPPNNPRVGDRWFDTLENEQWTNTQINGQSKWFTSFVHIPVSVGQTSFVLNPKYDYFVKEMVANIRHTSSATTPSRFVDVRLFLSSHTNTGGSQSINISTIRFQNFPAGTNVIQANQINHLISNLFFGNNTLNTLFVTATTSGLGGSYAHSASIVYSRVRKEIF